MYLSSLTLRDWKAYGGESRIELPAPTKKKNVVIIGAPNGFGKTSILEALLFGLYGRDALPLVARANKTFEGWGSSPERGSERLGVNLKRGSHVEGFAKTTDERTPHGNHAPGEAARQA